MRNGWWRKACPRNRRWAIGIPRISRLRILCVPSLFAFFAFFAVKCFGLRSAA
jgi:hypothetical protein